MWKSIDRIRDVETVGQRVEAEDRCARTWGRWMMDGCTKKWGKLRSITKPGESPRIKKQTPLGQKWPKVKNMTVFLSFRGKKTDPPGGLSRGGSEGSLVKDHAFLCTLP